MGVAVSVYSSDFVLLDVVTEYTSLIWTERYYEPGDFQLDVVPTTYLMNRLKPDNYLRIRGSDFTMVIEKVSMTYDTTDGPLMTVTGRSLESILNRRIVWGQEDFELSICHKIGDLIANNITWPENFMSGTKYREIPNFKYYGLNNLIDGHGIDQAYKCDEAEDVTWTWDSTNSRWVSSYIYLPTASNVIFGIGLLNCASAYQIKYWLYNSSKTQLTSATDTATAGEPYYFSFKPYDIDSNTKYVRIAVPDKIYDHGYVSWIPTGTSAEGSGLANVDEEQVSGDNLGDCVCNMLKDKHAGYRIIFLGWNSDNPRFHMFLYTGKNRATDRNKVQFRHSFGNLTSTEYYEDNELYINSVLIGGEVPDEDATGTFKNRQWVSLADRGDSTGKTTKYHTAAGAEVEYTRKEHDGIGRREQYVDGSGQSTKYTDKQKVEHTYTLAKYKNLLKSLGHKEYRKNDPYKGFSAEIVNYNTYTYGVDYFLGDKILFVDYFGNKGYGRITEWIRSYSASEIKEYPTIEISDYEIEDELT